MSTDFKKLKIVNARGNNLKGFSLEIPHDTFTVVTGVSGSGKSSLAFETVYAEGQRRYIETFSSYTRQFFDKVKKPQVDLVENVRPAIAIQQRNRITSSRSTVGSLTNIDDYLRIIWTNLAKPVCPVCHEPFVAWTPKSLAERLYQLLSLKKDSTFLVCAAVKVNSAKDLKTQLARLITLGYGRYYDPETQTVSDFENTSPKLDLQNRLIVLVDRFRLSNWDAKRAKEALEQAFSIGGKRCLIVSHSSRSKGNARPFVTVYNTTQQQNRSVTAYGITEYSSLFECPLGNAVVPAPRKALFSYNHPLGACPECKGFGKILRVDENLCVPNPTLTVAQNAVQCWAGQAAKRERQRLIKFCKTQKIPLNTPWNQLEAAQREAIFYHKSREYVGVAPWFKKIERKAYKVHVRVFLARYRGQFVCSTCHGKRLRPEALAYQINELSLADLWQMPISDLYQWLSGLYFEVSTSKKIAGGLRDVFEALLARLKYLVDLGLPYLTLDRAARTLSGGETQRVNLTAALGSELTSTHFVLDEPSVGLHPRDTARLIDAMRGLQQRGNSLLVVEHDPDCIMAADHIIELGPDAGEKGGELIYNGPREKWQPNFGSFQSLNGVVEPSQETLRIENASARNLKSISLALPLGRFVCLTGVSGSGKSSLISEVIEPAYRKYRLGLGDNDSSARVQGFEHINQLLVVDQAPLVKSPRSNIATYSKIWDVVRTLLASTPEAQLRGLTKGSFSFNAVGGRCPACKGAGFVKEDMQFLSDVYLPCELCLGQRFQAAVLEVAYRSKTVADFLNVSVAHCAELFSDNDFIVRTCSVLIDLGLGHLTLGHPLSELSGGEAQRLKLVPFVTAAKQDRALLIFDEPTTGLHGRDVERLIALFKKLTSKGHTVLCVEHNLALIAASDWIIDLGPEGGEAGGEVVLVGAPHDFLKSDKATSYTASYLQRYYRGQKSRKGEHGSHQKAGKAKVSKASAKISPISSAQAVQIKGAREHNLKNLSLSIPLHKVVALTGVSGSGKSTIAKDIIYAEGQRRYLDCLSPYARQFIKELKRPEVDSVSHVQPTVCVYQHTFQPARLSTVATMSEVYNYLRLLYAKLGVQFCPDHPEQQISPFSAEEIARVIKGSSSKVLRILAPIIKGKKGTHRAVLERAISSEISEVRVDGVLASAVKFLPGLSRNQQHSIDFVVAKFNPRSVPEDLVKEAVQSALALGGGDIVILRDQEQQVLSTSRSCPECHRGFLKPDPEDLSFNSRRGACEHCQGTGLRGDVACKYCGGSRLNALARNLRLAGRNIYQASQLTADELMDFLKSLELTDNGQKIAEPILAEIGARLQILNDFGLDYLKLARSCVTLSGGELQRLRLATAIGSPLTGVMYIFDEPSVGLHPLDNEKILGKICSLKDRGNSVIIIEHDAQSIMASDYVIDVGPGGGSEGGQIVFSGSCQQFLRSDTVTAQALRVGPSLADQGRSTSAIDQVTVTGSKNNVKDLELKIPLNQIVSVVGVSGAGKSSLVHGLLAETYQNAKPSEQEWHYDGNSVKSSAAIKRLMLVDQKPIGKNSRSTPASYLGVWDDIRKLYAQTSEARARGYQVGFFSYNTGKGRCQSCKGIGQIRHEMSFLADAWSICESCGGSRFTEDANSILYLGRSVSELLEMTFEEAKKLFSNHRRIQQILHYACDLGLGYLTLGQDSSTLSGGESQRIKLVSELSGNRKGHTIYLLDEPTTGLHKADVARLISTLRRLVDQGHSIIVIEHDPDFISQSDYVIELGPGPAEQGGKVIFEGPFLKLAGSETPWGRLLSSESWSSASNT